MTTPGQICPSVVRSLESGICALRSVLANRPVIRLLRRTLNGSWRTDRMPPSPFRSRYLQLAARMVT
jgi:hypothetical protein